jgi:hypothetical protein
MKSTLVALAVWLICTILSVDFVYQAGISEGQRIRNKDIHGLIAANKTLLSEVCYAWWFKTPPNQKNLSAPCKEIKRNSANSGTIFAQK